MINGKNEMFGYSVVLLNKVMKMFFVFLFKEEDQDRDQTMCTSKNNDIFYVIQTIIAKPRDLNTYTLIVAFYINLFNNFVLFQKRS